MGSAISHTSKPSNSITELFKKKSHPLTRLEFKVRHSSKGNLVEYLEVTILLDIAENPIVTRGVLLDWYEYAQRKGLQHHPFTNQAIPLHELLEIAKEQNVTFRRGDVLVIRTGWTTAYSKLTDAETDHLGGRDNRASCGIKASEAAIRWALGATILCGSQ